MPGQDEGLETLENQAGREGIGCMYWPGGGEV